MFPHPLSADEQSARNQALRATLVSVREGTATLEAAAAALAADPHNHINEIDARDLLSKMLKGNDL